jgi:hypothetical protein
VLGQPLAGTISQALAGQGWAKVAKADQATIPGQPGSAQGHFGHGLATPPPPDQAWSSVAGQGGFRHSEAGVDMSWLGACGSAPCAGHHGNMMLRWQQ